jgi:UDP-N-acetylmuramoyl-tripeptide--D-alanyl-D-alanine ligase
MLEAVSSSNGITFAEFAAWTGARCEGPLPEAFSGVTFDSRLVTPGCLYMAFPGATCDGHEFVAQALEKGAAAALVRGDWKGARPEMPLVRVEDPRAAMTVAARAWRRAHEATVVGVTGSAGKTTVKELVAAFLRAGGRRVHATVGNYNNNLGVPVTLLCAPRDAEFLVVEMGSNHPGEIQCLVDIALPDVGVISSIGTAHIEFFKTQDGIAEEKGALLAGLGGCGGARVEPFAVLAKENARYGKLAAMSAGRVVTTSLEDSRAARFAEALKVRLPGRHNVLNALLAAACAERFGVDEDACLAALANVRLPGGRWRVVEHGGVTWIDDTYNANPTAMIAALETFAQIPAHGRRVAVLGDMFELGEREAFYHAQVGARAKELPIDSLVFVGERSCGPMADGYGAKCVRAANLEEARRALAALVRPGDVVLLKASNGMRLGELLPGGAS